MKSVQCTMTASAKRMPLLKEMRRRGYRGRRDPFALKRRYGLLQYKIFVFSLLLSLLYNTCTYKLLYYLNIILFESKKTPLF